MTLMSQRAGLAEKKEIGISEGLIRISAGLENTEDLTAALKTVGLKKN